jgi:hypothetical protein
MKTYGGVEIKLQALLKSALPTGVWSASRSGLFISMKYHSLSYAVDKGLGGFQSRDEVVQRKDPCLNITVSSDMA